MNSAGFPALPHRREPALPQMPLGTFTPVDSVKVARTGRGVRLSRAYTPGMVETGWGRVVFISSESAINIPVERMPSQRVVGSTSAAAIESLRGPEAYQLGDTEAFAERTSLECAVG